MNTKIPLQTFHCGKVLFTQFRSSTLLPTRNSHSNPELPHNKCDTHRHFKGFIEVQYKIYISEKLLIRSYNTHNKKCEFMNVLNL